MWMYPVPEPDYDPIMELLEAGVKRLVQSKRMASQWRDCAVSPNKDRASARDGSKKARSNKESNHSGKENQHAKGSGKWFVDSDSDL
eukprot:3936968-Rhodomonas_salina.3